LNSLLHAFSAELGLLTILSCDNNYGSPDNNLSADNFFNH